MIFTNSMAANTARHLDGHYGSLATSVQRLSSGLRVNSAADDAAGLAIRELMRADVSTWHQGARNANDAISMIQTADGALSIIDEKLIRMKEIAEQAATGTYDSTQRLMIDSEFQAMASEIDRIANATEFNGSSLLDGSLHGRHNGSGLKATGAMKIHFGTGNDSAEDYYYVAIGDCTLAGLGLRSGQYGHDTGAYLKWDSHPVVLKQNMPAAVPYADEMTRNDFFTEFPDGSFTGTYVRMPDNDVVPYIDRLFFSTAYRRQWKPVGRALDDAIPGVSSMGSECNAMCIIPKGMKNVVINTLGAIGLNNGPGDNDIQLFTLSGIHLAGTPLDDPCFDNTPYMSHKGVSSTDIDSNAAKLGFTTADYDGSQLNSGPAVYDPAGQVLNYSTYNGMTIGYSGDPDRYENPPNDRTATEYEDYEVLTIDEVTEDLIVWCPGLMGGMWKVDWKGAVPVTPGPNPPDPPQPPGPQPPITPDPPIAPDSALAARGDVISIKTQELAQKALTRIDGAIEAKDKVRAHLGALQNRLENTVANIGIQSENMLAAESRISDADVAVEMTAFVRNQILTQSATAMLAQANNLPQLIAGLISG